jgi:peptidoglycan/xylan/chitin deacetylase (PgdA/CDA1 family)
VVENSEVVYDRKDQQVITRSHELTQIRQKSVVFTFDDGPGRYLPQILDVLKMEDVPAVFFWQTRLLHTKRPWRRVIEEGHLIGSHSCKHPDFRKMEYQEQYDELFYSKQKLEQVTGQPVRYFRPPFGQYDTCTLKALKALDMIPVMWSTASLDWELKEQPEQIVSNVVSHLEDGAIILLHELSQTLLVLPELIRQIRNEGYSFSLLPA